MHMNKKIKTNFYCKSKYWSRRMNKIRSTVNKMQGDKGFLPDLIYETEFQFKRIIDLLN